MSDLDLLYNHTKTQEIEKGIVNFKGDKPKWIEEKRKQRRRDKQRLKNVSKNDLRLESSI